MYHTFLALARECDPGVALELRALFTNRNSGQARAYRGPLSAARKALDLRSLDSTSKLHVQHANAAGKTSNSHGGALGPEDRIINRKKEDM